MTRQPHVWLMVVMVSMTAPRAVAGEARTYELARSLQMLQDQAVNGSDIALAEQPRILDRLSAEIALEAPAQLSDPRNVRALAIYLVNGGAPAVVRRLLATTTEFGPHQTVIRALLAFAERQPDAGKLLSQLDAMALEPGIGGPVALAQGMAFQADPAKAKPLLAVARLLAPGTLIEEAALRREITMLLAETKNGEAIERATRYLWKFGSSVYATDVAAYFATSVLPGFVAPTGMVTDQVQNFLAALPEPSRRALLLDMAKAGILDGRMGIAALASRQSAALGAGSGAEQARADIYAAIATAFGRDGDGASDQLIAIDRGQLHDAELGMLDAALAVAGQIPATPRVEPAADGDAPAVIVAARTVVARADRSLAEVSQ